MKINKKYKLILLMLLTVFMLYSQSIIYAAINSKVSITGDAVARIRSNVRINSFKIHEVSDGVISSYEDFSKAYTMSNVTLPKSDSYIIYELVIGNYEDVEMQLSNITGFPSNLTYELIDYNFHDMICDNTGKCFDGVEKTFYLKIKYENYNASGTNYNINLEYEFKEFSNKLMIGTSFRDTIPSNATHLVFTDEKPADGVLLTDVSFEQDMGVVGYLDGTTYKVSTRRTGEMPEAYADSSYMFNGKTLTNIDLSFLYTNKVSSMVGMFQDCTSLVDIVFGNSFNTDKVTNMAKMFFNCTSIESIDLSSFLTNNVKYFSSFLRGCVKLKYADVSNFDTAECIDFSYMFRDCLLLEEIDVSNFNTRKAVDFGGMFYNCNLVQVLDVSLWDTSSVIQMGSMFKNCESVLALDVKNFNTSNVTSLQEMFRGCKKISTLDITNWNVIKNTSIFGLFSYCESLNKLDLSNWKVDGLKIGYWVFQGCTSLIELNVSGWDFKNDISLEGMFFGLTNVEVLDVSNWNTSKVNNMSQMFQNCFKLKLLDLSTWDTSSVTLFKEMFHQCNLLEKIYIGEGWDTSSATNTSSMFGLCYKLPNFNSSYIDATKAYAGDGGYLSYPEIEFTIEGTTYKAEKGMTWREWYESDYCTNKEKYSIVSNYVCLYDLSFNPLTGWTSLEACDEEGNSYHSHVDQEIVSIDYIL